MDEAAPMIEENPVIKKRSRNIRLKGSAPERKSRRISGDTPDEIGGLGVIGRELKSLKRRGGMAGRWFNDASEWNYFPHQQSYLSAQERNKHNASIFRDLSHELDDHFEAQYDDIDVGENNYSTYQILNVQTIQDTVNKQCVCRCHLQSTLNSFLHYVSQRDNQLSHRLSELKKEWTNTNEFKNEIKIKVDNIGIHPNVTMQCSSCNKASEVNIKKTKYEGTTYSGKPHRTPNCSWYPLNLQIVLATLATGLGPSDLPIFLSLLGLPNLRSFSHQQYYRIECLIGKYLREIAQDSMEEALTEELRLTKQYKKENNIENNEHGNLSGLTTGYDMGWPKRSSGNRFDSMSRHAFLTGCHSKKIIETKITSKKCSVCSTAEAKGQEVKKEHCCPRNFEGSSKAMEAYGALSLVKKIYNKTKGEVFVEAMVLDDDASVRSILTHESVNPKGQLPEEIPQPIFLADPSHRTKVVAKAIFVLAHLPKSISTCTNIDALRIKKYYGYMLKQSRMLTLDEIRVRCKAVIEHLFDNHEFCDDSWCRPSRIEQEIDEIIETINVPSNSMTAKPVGPQEQDLPPNPRSQGSRKQVTRTESTSFYHSKQCDSDLYNQLVEAYAKYTTPERLKESLHPFDTQLNESLHFVVSKYAPKHKNYSTTMSLSNRISIVVGIHNMGHLPFWTKVFERLQLPMSEDLVCSLTCLDRDKQTKREYKVRHETKLKRVKNQIDKMADMMRKQKQDEISGATYGCGVGIQNIVPSEVAKIEKEKKKKNNISCIWFGCDKKQHKTNRNKQCKYHTCSSKEEIEAAVDSAMRAMYPQYYGE